MGSANSKRKKKNNKRQMKNIQETSDISRNNEMPEDTDIAITDHETNDNAYNNMDSRTPRISAITNESHETVVVRNSNGNHMNLPACEPIVFHSIEIASTPPIINMKKHHGPVKLYTKFYTNVEKYQSRLDMIRQRYDNNFNGNNKTRGKISVSSIRSGINRIKSFKDNSLNYRHRLIQHYRDAALNTLEFDFKHRILDRSNLSRMSKKLHPRIVSEQSHENNNKITVKTWLKTIRINYPSIFLDIKTCYAKSGFQLRDFTSTSCCQIQDKSRKNYKKKKSKRKKKF